MDTMSLRVFEWRNMAIQSEYHPDWIAMGGARAGDDIRASDKPSFKENLYTVFVDYYRCSAFLFCEWRGSSYGYGWCLGRVTYPESAVKQPYWSSTGKQSFAAFSSGSKCPRLNCWLVYTLSDLLLGPFWMCWNAAATFSDISIYRGCFRCWWHPITTEWSPPTPLAASKSFAPFHRLSHILRDILKPGANTLEGICFKSLRQM